MAAGAAHRSSLAPGLAGGARSAIEWLLLALIPAVALIQMPEGFMLGYIQVAKVSVFRTIAIALAGLWAVEWALTARPAPLRTPGEYARSAWGWLQGGPPRVMVGAALALIAVVGLSAALSPLPRLGFWGYDPGWDSYGLYSIACYVTIFLAAAAHIRTRQQVWRLLAVIAATGTLASVYGIGQHFGYDPLAGAGQDSTRASLTLGNPVFAGSVLAMTIPITLALIVEELERSRTAARLVVLPLPLMLQATALLFTLSRGPWVATAAGAVVFLYAAWRMKGGKAALWSSGLLAAAVAVGWLLTLLPAAGVKAGGDTTIAGRVGTIATEATVGTLGNRSIIWQTTARALVQRVSFDTEAYPELPEAPLLPLRPIIGYGPDTFITYYQLVGETRGTGTLIEHGHNFLVHTALELGVAGILVYLALAGSAALVLWRLLRMGVPGRLEGWLAWIGIALAGAFAARVVEQIVGKAQVVDFVIVWVLLGALIAAARLGGDGAVESAAPGGATDLQALAGRQQRRAERRRAARGETASAASVWRVGAASMLCVLLAVAWWSATLSPVVAARLSGEAIGAFEQGRVQRGISDLERAIDWQPRQALLHIQLSDALRGLAAAQEEAPRAAEGLRRAQDAIEEARAWNSADYRVWTRLSGMSRAAAELSGEGAGQALHYAKIVTVLLPGFTQPFIDLAWTYMQAGQPDAALAQSDAALDLAGSGATDAANAWFVRGLALAELDRQEEAAAALRKSIELRPTQQAQDALDALEPGA